MEEKIVFEDDPEAATAITMTVWKARTGQICLDERTARSIGCTHRRCDCGKVARQGRILCEECSVINQHKKYLELPFKEWDGSPLCLYRDDKYFFHEEEIIDFIEEREDENQTREDLELVICEPQYASEINADDLYCDMLPEDMLVDDIYPELSQKIEELNIFINKEGKPLSWVEGKYRTSYKYKQPIPANVGGDDE